ncbi:sensor histidine kinase [Microvirga puerhi]|uniref:histidine kinase n=1 Tax=Microvirga puerhi TaxID=2876078 RepID=A0ABS7VH98_9HYPH|nr:DUF4118 domain-containing protein [Microvirga puerhi]MBZ6074879.1 DUF4118 domain-containing protein [Microvirga puerhi]
MQQAFFYGFWTRNWPVWARYLGATLVIVLTVVLHLSLTNYLPPFPYLLFFPAIVINAVLFNRGTGIYSVFLSAALARFFFIEPVGSFAVADERTNLGLLFFLMIGLVSSAIIEALHGTARHLMDANERLAAAEREKALLLEEAAHRMKNDLATLAASVRLQGHTVTDPAIQDMFTTTANRIQVLSHVQDRLRPGQGASSIVDIADFINDLCDDLKVSLIGIRPIAIRVKVEHHWLPQERSVPVGIIINELVTNCVKYAFPSDRSGTIAIVFLRQQDFYELKVSDDGVGIASTARPNAAPGLGQRLVRSMATQLGGEVTVTPTHDLAGTCAMVRFPAAIG